MANGAAPSALSSSSKLRPFFEPIVSNRVSRNHPGPLRITAFNAASGASLDGIVACLAQPPLNRSSVILVCEADWGTQRTRRREIAKELAQRLEMNFVYIPEFGIPDRNGGHGSFFGNAILCTMPLEDVRAIAVPLPHPEGLRRMLRKRRGLPAGLVAKVHIDRRVLTVGVVHLASHSNPTARDEQMAAYLGEFPGEGPAVIGGDLNTTTMELGSGRAFLRTCRQMLRSPERFRSPQPYEPLFERLAAAGLQVDGANAMGRPTFTFARAIPPIFRPKLDWFAVRGVNAIAASAAVIPARPSFFSPRVSDHDFITVQLDL